MDIKEVFESLGFEWKETKDYIQYTKTRGKFIFKDKIIICFWKFLLSVTIYGDLPVEINSELLKAIHRQFEELEK